MNDNQLTTRYKILCQALALSHSDDLATVAADVAARMRAQGFGDSFLEAVEQTARLELNSVGLEVTS